MFGIILFISGQEIIFALLIALLLFGSKEIPKLARTFGKGMKEFKRATDDIKREIGVGPGETTDDLAYSVETVGCVGACALAPVILSNDDYITNIQPGSTGRRIRKAKRSR